ncbi:MAG: shikimate dehydrogenase [Lachnospiraceae bacterium]|nr:shikimate dehydrogenase [Lachnospiraceae bacterium]
MKEKDMINGGTGVCALIGDPVAHTLSPFIHNSLSECEGINSVYTAFRVRRGDTGTALKGAFALGIRGFNVTVPHKEDVIPFLCELDPDAKGIGAVNTLCLTDKGYKGYNTDVSGFIREIRECGFDIRGERVIMLGAGGAANAVLYALYSLGAEGVYILNRSVQKAEEKFGSDKRNRILPLDGFEEIEEEGYFCVQCTSAGLFPDTGTVPIEDESFYRKIDRAVDIIYNPYETEFMKRVKRNGGRAVNGLDMLLFQAVESFKLFHDTLVSEESIATVRERLKERVYGRQ